MDYNKTLSYLYSRLPMYQRVGAPAYKENLDNTIAICALLGNPEGKFRSVHIAGTNGKGSVSHMLAAVLQCAGYKAGLYTSPHLKDFRERIKINGKMIPKKYVQDFVETYKTDFEKIKPSFFEWTVGLAFDYFAQEKVDVAVIETGLGGRLDSTNVITPLLSVITNISYDHQDLLGNTLEKIAGEKAGIIKRNGIAVISEKQKAVEHVFRNKAREENALLLFAEDYLSQITDIDCELKGSYQQKNIPTVILVGEILNHLGFTINSESVKRGLRDVVKLTGLRGRWDVLSPKKTSRQKKPMIVADIAHNESGLAEVFKQVKNVPYKGLHVVFGTVNDKDLQKIFPLLPRQAAYYFCKANIPRALNAEILFEYAKTAGIRGQTFGTVKQALNAAKENASQDDLVLVTGSAFVVAEAI